MRSSDKALAQVAHVTRVCGVAPCFTAERFNKLAPGCAATWGQRRVLARPYSAGVEQDTPLLFNSCAVACQGHARLPQVAAQPGASLLNRSAVKQSTMP